MGRKTAMAAAVLAVALAAGWFALRSAGPPSAVRPDAPHDDTATATLGPAPRSVARTDAVVATGGPGGGSAGSSRPDPEAWLARLRDARDDEETARVVRELRRLPPGDSLAILRAVFTRIEPPSRRHLVLDHFAHQARFPVYAYAASVLDLGVRDPDRDTSNFALAAASGYALRPLSLDDGSYERWRELVLDRSVEDVVAASARDRARAIVACRDPDALVEMLRSARDFGVWFSRSMTVDVAAILREEHAIERLESVFRDRTQDDRVRDAALGALGSFVSESFLEREVYPALRGERGAKDEEIARLAAFAASHGVERSVPALLEAFRLAAATKESAAEVWPVVAAALQATMDARGIPSLIAAVETRPPDHVAYAIAQTLRALSGRSDKEVTGVSWRDWWATHRASFPKEASALDVPTFTLEWR